MKGEGLRLVSADDMDAPSSAAEIIWMRGKGLVVPGNSSLCACSTSAACWVPALYVLNQPLHICGRGETRPSENLGIGHQSGLEAGSVCSGPRVEGREWGGLAPRIGGWLEPQGHRLTGEWVRQDTKVGVGSVGVPEGVCYCFCQ